jgi:hypothetical protein
MIGCMIRLQFSCVNLEQGNLFGVPGVQINQDCWFPGHPISDLYEIFRNLLQAALNLLQIFISPRRFRNSHFVKTDGIPYRICWHIDLTHGPCIAPVSIARLAFPRPKFNLQFIILFDRDHQSHSHLIDTFCRKQPNECEIISSVFGVRPLSLGSLL